MKKFFGFLLLVLLIVALGIGLALLVRDTAHDEEQREGTNTDLTVPLQVVTAPNGSTLALVPVTIQDEGPYLFGLDTGASQTVVDDDIVQQLDLTTLGSAGPVMGIAGQTNATLVRVTSWSAGDVEIPSSDVVSFDLGEPGGDGLAGLLGSDVLSEFDAVTVDYLDSELRLESR